MSNIYTDAHAIIFSIVSGILLEYETFYVLSIKDKVTKSKISAYHYIASLIPLFLITYDNIQQC